MPADHSPASPESDMERALELANEVNAVAEREGVLLCNADARLFRKAAPVLARALIACREPVTAKLEKVNVCGNCKRSISGWLEDHLSPTLPSYCDGCGRPIKWTN